MPGAHCRCRDALPTQATDILDRINEITFNASLLKELRTVQMLKNLLAEDPTPHRAYRDPLFERVQTLRVHRIDADDALRDLGASSKLRTDAIFLEQLFQLGRTAANRWLQQHRNDLGQRGTLNLQEACRL